MQYGAGAAATAGLGAGTLPFTGFSIAWIAFMAVMFVLVGVALLRITRRTRERSPADA